MNFLKRYFPLFMVGFALSGLIALAAQTREELSEIGPKCIEYRVYGHGIWPTGLDSNADGYVTVETLDGISCVGYDAEKGEGFSAILFNWAEILKNGHEDWITTALRAVGFSIPAPAPLPAPPVDRKNLAGLVP